MRSLVGRFKILLVLLSLMVPGLSWCSDMDSSIQLENKTWNDFVKEVRAQERRDFKNGVSYIISGSLALAGGFAGSTMTEDGLEKGIYTVFQTIGIASIGYGAFIWKIGNEDRTLYQTLQNSALTPQQRTLFLKSYAEQRKEREKQERKVKAITHALIAGLNLYNATQQKQDSVKSGLYFIGGVNLLAAISYSF